MLDVFHTYIRSRITISDEELKSIDAACTLKKLRKKQYLLQEGDVWQYNAFVAKGCVRTYRVDERGGEHVIQFSVENWWTGDRESLLTGKPSRCNIDAIEDSEIILIKKHDFDMLCKTIPALNEMVNMILQRSFNTAQNRIHASISLSAEEKYRDFIEKYPGLVNRVPQGMIASYLGISPETLSRVRNQMSRNDR
ncbi:MAG TPA: Crp/Fnr family transcriptional regulator [Ohtaekwangia sp.]|uniref:Crp/Fnr family transcriptional regulator n=1 Tax=Ohtaekwangia sp. TaxID=2066019 RepID=UPI002F944B9C